MPEAFVHLHVHSHYSPLDGIVLIPGLLDRVKELGQSAVALTDHGVMYGAVDFYASAKKAGVKPIVGFEAYVAPRGRKERNTSEQFAYNHLTLLAKDFTGYQNLSRLCTEGFLTGLYRYPRVDKEILAEWSSGIVALSGCLRGEIAQLLLQNKMEEAEAAANWYRGIYGDGNFFLEVMNNGLADQRRILPAFRELSEKTGIPLVATADSHYLRPGDEAVQDIMICINTGRLLADTERMSADNGAHLKSFAEMTAALPDFTDAIENTLRVAELCNLELPLSGFHLPKLAVPDGLSPAEHLARICLPGLEKRYGTPLPGAVRERFDKEMAVITKMGFPDYFLIVWDVVNFAREQGIPVGPGRGSAAGSIVAYGLGITNLDPLKYGLFFERFLNDGRNEMPDIDLDFDKERRQEVITHIIERHGAEHCAKIITFGCLSLKSGIRDVGRVMGFPLPQTDRLAKLIPDMFKPGKGQTPLEGALAAIPDLKAEYEADPDTRRLLDAVGQLDGVMRNTGVHAAGVLVADRAITDYGPLAARDGEVTTQYEMKALEKFGLCKIDVLGLETLTLLRNAIESIKQNHGVELDLDSIPLDDKATLAMLGRGDAKGVFQFESDGFRQLLSRLKPDVFEDLIAAVAIYRPGPLQFLDSFIERKHGREKIRYLHPGMEPILRETYGLILYQEQVQALAQDLAHFTLSEGDLMRRAMSKKDAAIMERYRKQFIEAAGAQITPGVAERVYDQIEVFAGYGFNKSHSACYALIAYQTAYLKRHFPREYMAALLTINRGDAADIVAYSADAAAMGLTVLPLDVNRSGAAFAVEGKGIRYALSAVKGMGDNAARAIEAERGRAGPFRDLFDFTSRVDTKAVNKGGIEALIKAGGFDSFSPNRAALVAALDAAVAAGAAEQKSKASGQLGLFGGSLAAPAPALPDVPAWPERQKLAFEKAVLGFYSTSHPLAEHAGRISRFATARIADIPELENETTVTVGGLVSKIAVKNDKNGRRFASLDIEDMDGSIRCIVFSKVYEDAAAFLVPDAVLFISGRLDKSRDTPSIVVNSVAPLELVEERLAEQAVLRLPLADVDAAEEKLAELAGILAGSKGKAQLYFHLTGPTGSVDVRAGGRYSFRPAPEVVRRIAELFGPGTLELSSRRLAAAE